MIFDLNLEKKDDPLLTDVIKKVNIKDNKDNQISAVKYKTWLLEEFHGQISIHNLYLYILIRYIL